MIELRIPRALLERVQEDLRRPHAIAFERVGFLVGRYSSVADDLTLINVHEFHPVSDDHYIADERVGARIGEGAMAAAMQLCFNGRNQRDGVFHVHVHDHEGETGLSKTDARELPPMIPGFCTMGRSAAHGIIIFSRDHGSAWVWTPGAGNPEQAVRIVVTGAPIAIFERGHQW